MGEARRRIPREGSAGEYGREEIVLDDLIEVGPGDQIVVDVAEQMIVELYSK